jgi:hypothetical protein
MCIGKSQSPRGKPIDIGCFDFCGPIATNVAIPKIVGIDDYYVGMRRRCSGVVAIS